MYLCFQESKWTKIYILYYPQALTPKIGTKNNPGVLFAIQI